LRYFVDVGNKECFAAMLYTCYELIPEDLVTELSWRHDLRDYAMPYVINLMRERAQIIDQLVKDNEERKAKEAQHQTQEEQTPILGPGARLMITQGTGYGGMQPGQMNGIPMQATGYRPF